MTTQWEMTATEEGKSLRLLHADHGWLEFSIQQDEADAMAQSLESLLRTDAPYEADPRLRA